MHYRLVVPSACVILLTACGGGSGGDSSSSSTASSNSSSSSTSSGLSNSQRIAAAQQTAQNNAACTAITPFYWEIGDRSGELVSGSVGGNIYTAVTPMLIASASKWIWGAYVVQLNHGVLSAPDIAALNMQTGYTNFNYNSCIKLLQSNQDAETVQECFDAANGSGHNSDHDASADGYFYYAGGHFQKQAIDLGLGADNNAALLTAIQSQLGAGFSFTYDSPQLAGGASATPANYAYFLRMILNNQLAMHDLLGTHAVCTNVTTCANSKFTPVPANESWDYSLGHWVEDDPNVGDDTFSSPGAFGFYPWIDHSKTYYGIVARKDTAGSGFESVYCGRLIRKAWMTGVNQ